MDRADRCRAQADECHRLMQRSRSHDPDQPYAKLENDSQSDRPIRRNYEKKPLKGRGQVRIHLGRAHGRGNALTGLRPNALTGLGPNDRLDNKARATCAAELARP